jgi:predicted ATP-dependent serine protease
MKLAFEKTNFVRVADITIPSIFYRRMKTGIAEFDSLFGDGLLPGSSLTFTGVAGCGKTTALLQFTEALANNGYNVGYASGEENKYQLAYTCRRLKIQNVMIANETDVDALAESMKGLDVLVVDSFQALTSHKKLNYAELERYAVSTLVTAAKENECVLIFVMHLTKAGKLKGSTLVPHAVDVNFMISMDPDNDETARVIDVYKNRFGRTGTYSATMTTSGLEVTGRKEVERAQSKSVRNNHNEDVVMKMDPPNITKKRIIAELNITPSQAYLLLKKLTDEGKLVKFGRGDSAVWKKTNK